MTDPELLHEQLESLACRMRRCLVAAYGYAKLEASFVVSVKERLVMVAGVVLSSQTARMLCQGVVDCLPKGWQVDMAQLKLLPGMDWRVTRKGTTLFKTHPAKSWVLNTWHSASDGPLQVVAAVDGATLVRGIDGTVGWVADGLGEAVPAPKIALPRGDWSELRRKLRGYLDVPYLLGGTSHEGVDCSGLVQRCYRDALGLVLPRHSRDQLRIGCPVSPNCAEEGCLVFTWDSLSEFCHVGIVMGGESKSVIHASTTRRRVIEEPLRDFLRHANHVSVLPPSQIMQFHERFVGQSSIFLPQRGS